MTAREIAFGDVNAAALAAYPGLLKQWFPNGNMAGLEFCVGDTNGSKGQSLRVHIKKGVWKDFAGGDGGSDPISLYAAVHRLGQAEAKDRLAKELGLSSGTACSGAARSPGKAAQETVPAWRPVLPAPVPGPSPFHPRKGRPNQIWTYHDANGRSLFLACRFDKADGGKDVLPYVYGTYGGRTDWFWKHIPKDRPLYGLDRLHAQPLAQVIVTEGEKVADAAQRLLPDMIAITWPAGGKAVHLADWSPLKDRKVFVWPDADKEGAAAAEGIYSGGRYKPGVAQLIEAAGGEARIIDPPGTAEIARRAGYPEDDVPKGWDLADAEAEGWTSEDVVAWIREHRRPVRKPTPPPQADAPTTDIVVDLAERTKTDPGAPFEPEALEALANLRASGPAAFQRLRDSLKLAGVPMRDLNREIQKHSFRVIQGGAQGGDGATERAGPYKVVNSALCHERATNDGPVTIPLCNFDVRIVGEEIRDDGAERITVFAVEGALQGGKPLPRAEVLADRYGSMNWVTANWGTAPVVYAGQGTKDHLRVAIQMLSGDVPRRTVFGHLGWQEIEGEWFYLHHGGAIGPNGPNPEIQVQAGDLRLTCYALPDPPVGDDLRAAVRASLSTLDLGPPMLAYSLLGMVYSAPLGEVADLDLSGFIVGPTGAQKSELTAIGQAHYGAEFNRKRLPGNWATTANSLEKQAFLVKDAIFTIDDFAPAGTVADVARQHKDADRVFRGQGNRAGRGRMRPDGSRRPEYFPRGIVLSSGEDVPRGESLRSRGLFLEVSRRQVDLARLTEAQDAAAAGLFAQAMAAYVQWLAPQIDALKEQIPARHRELRADARKQPVTHDRTPDIVASLATGWEMFLRFAREAEAITDDEQTSYWQQAWAMLSEAAEVQAGFQASEEPTGRFVALLAAAIVSGQAHVADAATNEEPAAAGNWGWQRRAHTSGAVEHEEWQPRGMCVGWIESDDLYLNPESAFAAVQRLAQAQGASLPITAQTLWKRLFEKGILASRDETRRRNIVRKVIAGSRRNVIHILADTLLSHKSGPIGPIGPRPRESAASRAEKMGRFYGDEEKAAHETGPQPLENSDGGPNGPIGPQMEHKGPAPAESFAETSLSGDSEEREAIRAIDGEGALCVQCGEFVSLEEEPIPVAGGRVLHERCYDDWYEAQFGKRPTNDPEGAKT